MRATPTTTDEPDPHYRVLWEIDAFGAADVIDAARRAREHQTRARTTATVFAVFPPDGAPVTVDLSPDDPDQAGAAEVSPLPAEALDAYVEALTGRSPARDRGALDLIAESLRDPEWTDPAGRLEGYASCVRETGRSLDSTDQADPAAD